MYTLLTSIAMQGHQTKQNVVDSHIQRIVLVTEQTNVAQQVSRRPIKCQSRSWSQRGTSTKKVDGSHHGDNPLLKPRGIQIATEPMPGPNNREHRKTYRRQDNVFGYELQFLLSRFAPLILAHRGSALPWLVVNRAALRPRRIWCVPTR